MTKDIGADVGKDVLYPRLVDLRQRPAGNQNYAGGGNLMVDDRDVQWTALMRNPIQDCMYCFRLKIIK